MLLQRLEMAVLATLKSLRWNVLLMLFVLVELIPNPPRYFKSCLLWFIPRSR